MKVSFLNIVYGKMNAIWRTKSLLNNLVDVLIDWHVKTRLWNYRGILSIQLSMLYANTGSDRIVQVRHEEVASWQQRRG